MSGLYLRTGSQCLIILGRITALAIIHFLIKVMIIYWLLIFVLIKIWFIVFPSRKFNSMTLNVKFHTICSWSPVVTLFTLEEFLFKVDFLMAIQSTSTWKPFSTYLKCKWMYQFQTVCYKIKKWPFKYL